MCGGAERINMELREEFLEFCHQMQKAVQKCFPKDVRVEIRKIVKNNSLELDSLVILSKGQLVSPNFYLQSYYEEYKKGLKIETLAEKIRTLYYEITSKGEDIEFDLSYENCADRVIFRLVSYEKNKKLFQTVPYIQFLDLAIIFYLLIRKEEEGIGSIRINNYLMEKWGLDTGAIFNLARENTERIFPERICSMNLLMNQILNSETNSETTENFQTNQLEGTVFEGEPYVVTNDNGINGAAVILYPNTLKKIGKLLGGDFYLLPSSIHEMIAIPIHAAISEEQLYDMVCEVNQSCVAEEEILSDSVYRFENDTEIIKICKR